MEALPTATATAAARMMMEAAGCSAEVASIATPTAPVDYSIEVV